MKITAIAGALGAQIEDVNLCEPVDDHLYQSIRAALVEHQVLFFRNQPIKPEHQKALAIRFGPLQTHPAYGTIDGFPEVSVLESTPENPTKIEQWHSDMTFRAHPPMATLLCSRITPAKGGDTLWASMTAAFDALSPNMQKLLQGLTAVHDFRQGFKESLAEPDGQKRLQPALDANPPVQHPVVRTHPESGKKLIFVNELFTSHILELKAQESQALLGFLFEHIKTPEFSCRFHWNNNAIAFWDNRSTQHKPINDYFPAHRRMERIAIDGDKPY